VSGPVYGETATRGCGGLTSTCVKAATTRAHGHRLQPGSPGAGGIRTRYAPRRRHRAGQDPHLADLDTDQLLTANRQHSDASRRISRTTDDQLEVLSSWARSPGWNHPAQSAPSPNKARSRRILERCPTLCTVRRGRQRLRRDTANATANTSTPGSLTQVSDITRSKGRRRTTHGLRRRPQRTHPHV